MHLKCGYNELYVYKIIFINLYVYCLLYHSEIAQPSFNLPSSKLSECCKTEKIDGSYVYQNKNLYWIAQKINSVSEN